VGKRSLHLIDIVNAKKRWETIYWRVNNFWKIATKCPALLMSEHHFWKLKTLMTFHFLERLTAVIVVPGILILWSKTMFIVFHWLVKRCIAWCFWFLYQSQKYIMQFRYTWSYESLDRIQFALKRQPRGWMCRKKALSDFKYYNPI
jgi:hypothetical protein